MSIAAILSDPGFARLKAAVLEHTGLHYYDDKSDDLAARLARRMSARSVDDCLGYLHLLENDDRSLQERDALVGELTIGETYFFRQMEHFDLLRERIIPEILSRNAATRKLRIWSAGCATGAEPYSISLILKRDFPEQLQGWEIAILATDINVDFLARARTGRFAEWALRDVDASTRKCCFYQEGRTWTLHPQFRANVTFEYHNLAGNSPYPGSMGEPFDMILCRNVLIYFSRQRIREVAARLYGSLAIGGWLLVGHAEPRADVFPEFEVVNDGRVSAYRRSSGLSEAPRPAEWKPTDPPNLTIWNEPPPRPQPLPRRAVSETKMVAETPSAGSIDRARALADAGEWEAAAAICRRLIEANSLSPAVHFTLGLILSHHGSFDEAHAALRRAIYLDRRFALAHYHLGMLLQAAGRRAEARKAFTNVVDLLATVTDDDVVQHGDGLKAGELRELASMHLELVKER